MFLITKADGSVIIDTKLNTAGFGKGASNLKGQFASLRSSLGKLGVAIGAAFSVKAIADFSKKALELGSDLQEVQNVVNVTFTTMNKQVDAFAKNAAKTAGLSETMAKKYAGTFGAMSKSFGFTEAEAYDMSTALTQLTGDVASFYNLTQDEAYTKLKSVFTGETESLKDLGVVMTQTALDDFAMRKGLGKTTQQMSEQEKVALRYQFVLDQLAGASGDFVRTQDGWANQTRILKLQTESLLATFGQGLINVLTPAIKVLNTIIAKLQECANVFKQVTEALFGNASDDSPSTVAGALGSAAENAGELEDNITDAGKAAKKAVAGFDEINVLSEKESNADNIGGISLDETLQNGDIISEKEEKKTASGVGKIVDSLLKLKENLQSLAKPIKDFDLKALSNSIKKCKDAFGKFGGVIKKKVEWAWFNVLVPLGKWAIEKAAPKLIDVLSEAFRGLGNIIDYFWPTLETLWKEFLKPLAGWTGKIVIGALDLLGNALKKLGDHFDLSIPKAYELSDAEKEISENATLAYLAFEKQKTQSEKTEKAIEQQYDDVKLLADELLLLADGSGRVESADKDRADFILGRLNDALGTEYKMVGNVIQQYSNLKDEIYSLISAKKANLLLDANSETYTQALLAQNDAYADMKAKERAYVLQEATNRTRLGQLQAKLSKLKKGIYDYTSDLYFGVDPTAYAARTGQILGEIDVLENNIIPSIQKAIEEEKKAYEQSAAQYKEIFNTIYEYDQASALIAQGKYEEAIQILSGYASAHDAAADGIEDAAERERRALEKKATDAAYYAQRLQEEFEAGSNNITKEAVQAAIGAYEDALDALRKVDLTAAEDLANRFWGVFSDTLKRNAGVTQGVINGYSMTAMGIAPYGNLQTTLPHLAKGTVIPPNAPFMAVLGDQRHGTNIEAPLETIKQALAEVLAMQNGGGETNVNVTFTGDLAQLARVLKPAIETETRRKGGSLAKGAAF